MKQIMEKQGADREEKRNLRPPTLQVWDKEEKPYQENTENEGFGGKPRWSGLRGGIFFFFF